MPTQQTVNAGATLRAVMTEQVPGPLVGPLSKAFALDRFERLYDELRSGPETQPLPQRLIERLEVSLTLSKDDLDRIPLEGPVVAVANHPFGLLDAAILAALLPQRRPDVKFLGNRVLEAIPEISERLVVVNPDDDARGAAVSVAGLRRALTLLREGGMLTVFPAGEVSHWAPRSRRVEDRDWHPSVGGLIRRSGATAVPIYVEGANSVLFQVAGLVHPRLRTALLPRELLNKERRRVTIRIGAPIAAEKLGRLASDRERADYLRWRTYLLAHRQEFKARTSVPFLRRSRNGTPGSRERSIPIAPPSSAGALSREIEALGPEARRTSGELSCYVAPAERIPTVLDEIARLREVSFRQVGEGTGQERDRDRFDDHYLHLFVWKESKREIVGAYRFCHTDRVREQFGRSGLYTAKLFRYPDELLDAMGPSLELGRSFVRPEYQTSFAPLLTLWKGIGRYVDLHPKYKTLFGPVTISALYRPICRKLMVSFLSRHLALREWTPLVKPRHPLSTKDLNHTGLDLADLTQVLGDIDSERPGLPVLLRQYLKLGGKLLGFSVDPAFGDALDGLIVVDLTKTDPKALARYMGKDASRRFLSYHRDRNIQ